ncbi:MAG: heme A synthase [Rhizobiales bacterium 12-68-15]|nr:MAG: heme A synthase [Rhizobiales bacterium 12-68-15]
MAQGQLAQGRMARDLGQAGPARGVAAVRIWLYLVAALVVAMVVVGGATRLTESGLSITEWKPVTGALRVIGFAFLLPFLYFVARGVLRGPLLVKSLGLFVLGGLQGAIGWWMVASGLTERVSVSQYRLAVHLTLACIILSATVAVARSLTARPVLVTSPTLRAGAWGLLLLVVLQIFSGGLVAGLDAGMTFNTWPLMDGAFIPPVQQLAVMSPGWRNLFENAMTVQFQHRMIAYTLWGFALLHALHAQRFGGTAARQAWLVLALVSAQAVLGILTLVFVVPIDIALTHQFGATLVLIAATIHVGDLGRTAPAAGAERLSSARA